MKNLKIAFLLLIIFLNFYQTAHASVGAGASENDSIRKPYYWAWVHTNSDSRRIKCFIYETTDSSLLLVKNRYSTEKQEIPVNQIGKITFRRVNNPWVCALAGAGISAIIGAVWGYSDGDDEPNGIFYLSARDKAFGGAVLLFPIGLVVGFGLGLIKKRRKLSGSLQNYERERVWMQRFTLTRK